MSKTTYAPTIPPSAFQLEKSISLWQQLQAVLQDDATLETDESTVSPLHLADGSTVPHPRVLMARAIDAAIWCGRRVDEADELRKKMVARRDRYAEREDKIRDTIVQLAEVLGITAMEAEFGTFSMVRQRQSVVVTDVEKLYAARPELVKVEKTAKALEIGPLLKAGETIDGVELSNPGTSPRITAY